MDDEIKKPDIRTSSFLRALDRINKRKAHDDCDCHEDNADLRIKVKKLRAMLRETQHGGHRGSCHSCDASELDACKPDCELAKLLGGGGE